MRLIEPIADGHPGELEWVALVYPCKYSADELMRQPLMSRCERQKHELEVGQYVEVAMQLQGQTHYFYRVAENPTDPARVMLTPCEYSEAAGLN